MAFQELLRSKTAALPPSRQAQDREAPADAHRRIPTARQGASAAARQTTAPSAQGPAGEAAAAGQAASPSRRGPRAGDATGSTAPAPRLRQSPLSADAPLPAPPSRQTSPASKASHLPPVSSQASTERLDAPRRPGQQAAAGPRPGGGAGGGPEAAAARSPAEAEWRRSGTSPSSTASSIRTGGSTRTCHSQSLPELHGMRCNSVGTCGMTELEGPRGRLWDEELGPKRPVSASAAAKPRHPLVPRLRLERIQEAEERRRLERLQAKARKMGLGEAVTEAGRAAAVQEKDSFIRAQLEKLLVNN